MIKNRSYHNLFMDYSSYIKTGEHPSDIDMFYITDDDILLLGEIKNESYDKKYWNKQKKILQRVIDNYNKEAFYFFITHNKYVQKGDTEVDVPNCYIKEYYYKGKWRTPKKELKVKDILEKYVNKENKMEIISNKEEMIFRKDYNGRPIYSIGLSKKKKDGSYEKGYMAVNFKEGTNIVNQSKIRIKQAWISFYLKDNKTIPTLFINDYELISIPKPKEEDSEEKNLYKEFGENIKIESNIGDQIEITDQDFPF